MKREFFGSLKEASPWGRVNIKISPVLPFFPFVYSAKILGEKMPICLRAGLSFCRSCSVVVLLECFKFTISSSCCLLLGQALVLAVLCVFSRKTVLPVGRSVASRKAKLLNLDYLPRPSCQSAAVSLGVKKQTVSHDER